MTDPKEKSDAQLDSRPPLLGSWRNLYLLVLGALALQVALYYALTRAYSP
jgi:hypothetical protein